MQTSSGQVRDFSDCLGTQDDLAIAVACARLGGARTALRQLLTLKPELAVSARKELGRSQDPELVEHLMDGLRKSGLEVADDEGTATAKPAADTGS